jgi:hypothetical protein
MRGRLIDRDESTYGIGYGPLATLGAGVSLWIRHIVPLTGLTLVPAVAGIILEWIAGTQLVEHGTAPEDARQAAAGVAGLLTFPLAYGATAATYLLLDARVLGAERETGAVSFYGRGLKRFGRLFGVFFMMGLVLMAPLVPAGVLWSLDLRIPAIPLAALAVGFDVWLLVRWSVAAPVAVIEGVSFSTAFERSKGLVKGRWWRTFATLAPTGVAVALLTAGIWEGGLAIGEALDADDGRAGAISNFAIALTTAPPLDCVLFALYAGLKDRERAAA